MLIKGITLINAKQYEPELVPQLCNEISAINFKSLYEDVSDRVTSLFIISLFLHKCCEYKIIIDLAKKHIPLNDLLFTQWGEQNWNHYKIIYTDSLLKTNEIEKATELFKSISSTNYDLNFSPITDAIYKNLQKELGKI